MPTPDPSLQDNAKLACIGGRRLDARTVGPGDIAPSIVFLHEGLGSVELWRGYPTEVAKATDERAVVYSRYGHGWSEVQRERRSVDFMDHEAFVVLPDLIETFAVENTILIGHSDGASIALLHASQHQVDAMVLLAPHVFTEPGGLGEIRHSRARFEDTDLVERMARYHDKPAATFNAWNNVWLHPDFESWNIEAVLPNVTCPVLLIQGEDEEYGTPAQLEAISSQIGETVEHLFLSDCRHSPHLDRPATTSDATAGFIRDTRADL